MAYQLGQYNHLRAVDNTNFLSLITAGTARVKSASSEGSIGSETFFEDECVQLTGERFEAGNHYYFHGKIKRMNSNQRLYIKMINYDDDENVEQYIKTIYITKGNPSEWIDVEFMFSPIIEFDSLLFELQRESSDYIDPRKVIIAYEEVSLIKNIVKNGSMIGAANALIKLGVQSRPGLLMCIEGEEIHTPRSGIYELKNGLILINFLSIVSPAKELGTEMETWMNSDPTESRCFFGTSKERTIDSFTIDYIYQD